MAKPSSIVQPFPDTKNNKSSTKQQGKEKIKKISKEAEKIQYPTADPPTADDKTKKPYWEYQVIY